MLQSSPLSVHVNIFWEEYLISGQLSMSEFPLRQVRWYQRIEDTCKRVQAGVIVEIFARECQDGCSFYIHIMAHSEHNARNNRWLGNGGPFAC